MCMHSTVAQLGVPYIAMHMKGTPQNMQKNITGGEVMPDLLAYLASKVQIIRQAGIKDLILDPGFGFGKSLQQNYEMARQIPVLNTLGCPLLVGVSRKSMLSKIIDKPTDETLNATTALHMALLANGAQILRVHDVKEAMECIDIHQALSTSEG